MNCWLIESSTGRPSAFGNRASALIMNHPIYRIVSFEQTGAFILKLRFDDGLLRTINFEPVLAGEIFEPLRDPTVFSQVRLDKEIHTLTWPNGADFDPSTLHDWPEHEAAFIVAAQPWDKLKLEAV